MMKSNGQTPTVETDPWMLSDDATHQPEEAWVTVATADEPMFVAQPALVIGAGGIGHRVLLAFKAELIAAFGEVPSGIRLLAIDIDDENLSTRVNGRLVRLEPGRERFCIGPIPVARIRRNLRLHPTIAERVASISELPHIAAANAAQAQRLLGLLALLWQYAEVRDLICRNIRALAGKDNYGDEVLQVNPGRGVKVIQIGSLCGGTNSGQCIDIGHIVRAELEALGTLGEACASIGIGMLPGAFHGTNSPNLVPNTVAVLRELEKVMMEGGLVLTYRDEKPLETARPPFDMYLLVDAVDEAGRVWPSREALCQMLGRALVVLCATTLGEQGDVPMDNVGQILATRTEDGRGRCFGSIGLAQMELPVDDIVDLCTARHLVQVLDATLLRPSDDEGVALAVTEWCQRQGVDPAIMAAQLPRDDHGTPLATTFRAPARLRQATDRDVPALAMQFVADWKRIVVQGEHDAAVRRQAEVLRDQWCAAVTAWSAAKAGDSRCGLRYTVSALDALAARLVNHQSAVQVTLDRARANYAAAEAEVDSRAKDLRAAVEVAWPFRRARLEQALDAYLREAMALGTASLEVTVAAAGKGILAHVASACDAERQRLADLAAALVAQRDQVQRRTVALATKLDAHQGDPALRLVDRPFLDAMFNRHAPAAEASLSNAAVRLPGGIAGAADDPRRVALALWAAAEEAFTPIRDLSVEAVMRQRRDYSPEARLAALRLAAVPALNLDHTRLPDGEAGLRQIEVIGVTDASTSLLSDGRRTLVTTHDPHRVMALKLTIGTPYTAVQAWPEYEAEYHRVARRRPLHVLPGFEVRRNEHKLAFALGLAFGLVRSRGAHHYYQPSDELVDEAPLGQGVEKALQGLLANEAVASEIIERVERHIEVVGTDAALGVLAEWTRANPRDDDLARDLKRIARDYAEQLDSSARLRSRTEGR